ncbi:MAG TPA: SDR family NAD(P)-dependent oxidoreductase, partial [Burkholderiaceae bacterium]
MITGAASGIGKATAALAEERGWRALRVDRQEGDVRIDLATLDGRRRMLDAIDALAGGKLDAVIACAGVSPPGAAAAAIVQINYFGAIATLDGLRPLLARGDAPRAVVVSSWASIQTVEPALVDACLAGDEALAVALAKELDSPHTYATSKAAVARWTRRNALGADWLDAGILLNAIAPGMVATPMIQGIVDSPAVRAELEKFMPRPLRRDAQPREMAELLC